MAIAIEIFERNVSRGTFLFEASPRINEMLEIKGSARRWRVVDVRHLAVRDAPAQLQIAVERAATE